MHRLLILSTHPIQYHTPWYKALDQHPDIDLMVYYCHRASPDEQGAAGFGVNFEWDVPLLEGYQYEFLKNEASEPSISRFNGLDTPEIADRIRSEKFDAVLVSGWTYKAAWQTFIACWRQGIPIMVRSDSHLHTQRSVLKRIAKYPLYRGFLTRMSAALAVGTWSADYFAYYGVPRDRIFIVPHVVDETRFLRIASFDAAQRGDLRQQWQISEDAVVFTFCGKLIEKKHPLDFIYAVLRAREVNGRVVGLVVGDGPLRTKAESAASTCEDAVVFAGFQNQSQLPSIYALSDVIVLPSNAAETWGLVVNEAMLSGLPAIVSDQVGCGTDLIVAGQTGDTFPHSDIGALASLMSQYAQDLSRLRAMGTAAQLRLCQHFGIDQAVTGVVRALEFVTRQ